MTEDWLARNMYCHICGAESIQKAESNAPVKDYVCKSCRAQYELKSKKSTTARFKSSVVDGGYSTMIERISSLENPSFFFMHYDRYEVNNLIIVPKCFFIPDIIQKRTQLKSTAARAQVGKGVTSCWDRSRTLQRFPLCATDRCCQPRRSAKNTTRYMLYRPRASRAEAGCSMFFSVPRGWELLSR